MGFLVEVLRDRRVEAFGVDISEYALQQVQRYPAVLPGWDRGGTAVPAMI
jgi:hypothetical protein